MESTSQPLEQNRETVIGRYVRNWLPPGMVYGLLSLLLHTVICFVFGFNIVPGVKGGEESTLLNSGYAAITLIGLALMPLISMRLIAAVGCFLLSLAWAPAPLIGTVFLLKGALPQGSLPDWPNLLGRGHFLVVALFTVWSLAITIVASTVAFAIFLLHYIKNRNLHSQSLPM